MTTHIPSPHSDATTVLLVLPAAVLLLGPFAMLAHAAAGQPEVLDMLLTRPMTTALLAGGLLISLMLCGMPFVLRTRRTQPSAARSEAPVIPSHTAAASDCHPLPA